MKTLVMLLLLLLPLVAFAQEGTVRYEETIKLDIQLPPEMEHMKDRFPETRTSARLLLFNASASLMKNAPEAEPEEQEVTAEAGGRHMRMRFGGRRANDEVYTHFDDWKVIEKRDFMDRTFLITGEPEELAWRLTGEQSEFLGYLCQKAVTMRDTVAVEAWFTPQIQVPAGPGPYNGLPGLILVLTEDAGRRTFVATELSLEPPADAIAAPDKGREMSRADFDALVAEKMKEMGAERRGRGGFIIRH